MAWLGTSIARRPWHAAERRVIHRGFWGRLLIAVEPLVIALFFVVLVIGMIARHQDGWRFFAPIFAGASLLFFGYAVALMFTVTRALVETFGPIFVVDGYVSYREELVPFRDPIYYVAVLDDRRQLLGEWKLASRSDALERGAPWPALVEFTRYGGILRIDGRSTGVLPDDIPAFGIGAPAAYAERVRPAPEEDEL